MAPFPRPTLMGWRLGVQFSQMSCWLFCHLVSTLKMAQLHYQRSRPTLNVVFLGFLLVNLPEEHLSEINMGSVIKGGYSFFSFSSK